MNHKKFLRKDLYDFKPYTAKHIKNIVKLDANESPFPMDDQLKNEIIQWIDNDANFNVYPDSNSNELREAIAKYYDVTKDNVVCGVGSDQLIDSMIRGIISPGDVVVYPDPSFSMYQSMISLNHGKGIPVPLNDDFTYNVDSMIKACIKYEAKLLILCSPNNPTGNSLSLEDIKAIASNVNCPIMLDEAYGEFIDDSGISLIDEYDNIVVLRTFSKVYGLAGLRIGYGIGSYKALYPIIITTPPYNINSFTQMVATKVIENQKTYQQNIDKMKSERLILENALNNMGFKVYPSDTNFLLVESHDLKLDKYLQSKNIYIRSMNIQDKIMYRISVGTKTQNKQLIDAIKEVIS